MPSSSVSISSSLFLSMRKENIFVLGIHVLMFAVRLDSRRCLCYQLVFSLTVECQYKDRMKEPANEIKVCLAPVYVC